MPNEKVVKGKIEVAGGIKDEDSEYEEYDYEEDPDLARANEPIE